MTIAQQTVAPDAVTRVFPSVGGYKEFAPTINYSQTRIFPGAQFFTPAYHIRSITNLSTRPDPHVAGAGEPGSWAHDIMTYNKLSVHLYKNDDMHWIDCDVGNSNARIICEQTSRGYLIQWYITIDVNDNESDEEVRNINCEIDHYELRSDIPLLSCMKRDASPVSFGQKNIGQCTIYTSAHDKFIGFFRIFSNDKVRWIHLESNKLEANVPIIIDGIVIQERQTDIMKSAFEKSGLIVKEIIKIDYPDYGQGNMLLCKID